MERETIKCAIVFRLVRGEDLGEVSREIKVPASEIKDWRARISGRWRSGPQAASGDALESEFVRRRAKLGEMTMRPELSEDLLEKGGYMPELKKLYKRDHA
jgi:hypothetical protein